MGKLSKLQLKKAEERAKITDFNNTLKAGKKNAQNPYNIITAIYYGYIRSADFLQNSGIERIYTLFQQIWYDTKHQAKRENFYELLQILIEKKANNLLDDEQMIDGLAAVASNKNQWLRDIKDWKPNSHNCEKRFADLLRFLFAKYRVPAFMDTAFYQNEPKYIQWYIQLAQGISVRQLNDVPVSLTSKMAHFFMQSPADFNIREALRWGQVLGMGGDKRLASHLIATRLGRTFENEDFWETVIRFFVNNPMLDPVHINPIIDFIQYQKFAYRRVALARGVIANQPPPNPGFTMKGRTVPALLRAVEEWHQQLHQFCKLSADTTWEAFKMDDFEYEEGDELTKKTYYIRQLLTIDELKAEGNAMRHCVASYGYSCSKGNSAIWSLTVEDCFGKKDKLLTLEVDKNLNIVQAKGKYNAPPTAKDMEIIYLWAVRNGLRISKWITY